MLDYYKILLISGDFRIRELGNDHLYTVNFNSFISVSLTISDMNLYKFQLRIDEII